MDMAALADGPFVFMNGSFIFYVLVFSPALISPLCPECGSQAPEGGKGSSAVEGTCRPLLQRDGTRTGKTQQTPGRSLGREGPVRQPVRTASTPCALRGWVCSKPRR